MQLKMQVTYIKVSVDVVGKHLTKKRKDILKLCQRIFTSNMFLDVH